MDNIHHFQCSENIMDEAYAWVLKFNRDQPVSSDDIAALREWVSRSPAHPKALNEAENFWSEAELLSGLAVPLQKKSRGRVAAFSNGFLGSLLYSDGVMSATWRRTVSFASVVLLSIVLLFLLQVSWQIPPNGSSVGNSVYRTVVGEQSTLVLNDGSKVLLDTKSKVRIAYD